MTKEKLRIGIAGCGWIAKHAHLPALAKDKRVNIKAAFDINLIRAKEVCNEFLIQYAFDDFRQFLDCGLDGIIIATPNFTHVPYTMEALRRKINVLCEKPVGFKEEEMQKIIKLSEENDVVYVPGFVNRWRQDIKTIYDLIQSGRLGEINQVDAGWIRKYGVPRPGTWFTNKKYSGGGVLMDLGSHIIDICGLFLGTRKPLQFELLTCLCNAEKIKHSGEAGWFQSNDICEYEINVEDTAIGRIMFEGQAVINVSLSWLAPVEADCTYFKVKGSKGEVMLKTLFGFSNERLWKDDLLVCDTTVSQTRQCFNKNENQTRNAFTEMLSYFVDAIISKKKGFTDGKDAKNTVLLIENLYKNAQVNERKCLEILSRGSQFWNNFI